MKKLLALLLFPSLVFAQPLPGNSTNLARIAGTPIATVLAPESSSTGQAVSVDGPMGAIWLTNSGLTGASTSQVLVLSSSPGVAIYRGDRVTVSPTISFSYGTDEFRAEVESVSGVNITLTKPLPFTPTASYYAKFFRRADIPIVAGTGASPYVATDALNYYATDGVDALGFGTPYYHLPMGGWDQANSKNRMFRITTTTPGASDYGLIVRGAGTFAATQSGSWSLAANQSVNVAQINGVAPSMGNGASGTGVQRVTIANDSTGVIGLSSGTNTIGGVILKPTTSGGVDTYTNINVNATGVNIKASAGQLYGYYCFNNSSTSVRYVRLYDSASAPTVGSTTKKTIFGIPANAAANVFSEIGVAFSSGIGIGATGAVGDADTTNPSSNDVVCTIYYK